MDIYLYTQCFISTIVINQPGHFTVCEGKGAVFSCVLNTANFNINDSDVQWYRLIEDTGITERVNQSSNIHFTTSTINNTLTTSLNITNARRFYTGYYWIEIPSLNVCNASLTVLTSMWIHYTVTRVGHA